MLSIIVAIAKDNVIGKDNKLPWHIPEDLKRFKKITKGHTVIMGRNTYLSIGKALPYRRNIVISSEEIENNNDEDIEIIDNINDLNQYIKSDEECFVIGGQMIYKLLLPYATKLYITKINEEFEGDTFFPEFNENEWNLVSSEKGIYNEDNPYDYEFQIFERK